VKVIDKKKSVMSTNITVRLQDELLKAIADLAKQHKVSRQLIVNRIIEKSLKDRNFSIVL
jgi:predicted transcriptional regulator